jgi:hypothetical protein
VLVVELEVDEVEAVEVVLEEDVTVEAVEDEVEVVLDEVETVELVVEVLLDEVVTVEVVEVVLEDVVDVVEVVKLSIAWL